jgi:hypothetical protein
MRGADFKTGFFGFAWLRKKKKKKKKNVLVHLLGFLKCEVSLGLLLMVYISSKPDFLSPPCSGLSLV